MIFLNQNCYIVFISHYFNIFKIFLFFINFKNSTFIQKKNFIISFKNAMDLNTILVRIIKYLVIIILSNILKVNISISFILPFLYDLSLYQHLEQKVTFVEFIYHM